jgi:hypothetical protein
MKISKTAARRMGWYVYAYVDPRDDGVFYVGKGRRHRMLHGLKKTGRGPMATTIREIRKARLEPRIDILAHGMKDEKTALRLEAALIDALDPLANRVRGWRAVRFGRAPLQEVVALYDRRSIKVREPAVLIRITHLYRPLMSQAELYDATRAVWKVQPRRASKVKLAFAVFDGVVREVYEVTGWFKAGSTFLARHPRGERMRDRSEFVGRVADEKLQGRYINRDVSRYFPRGARNPVCYVNV